MTSLPGGPSETFEVRFKVFWEDDVLRVKDTKAKRRMRCGLTPGCLLSRYLTATASRSYSSITSAQRGLLARRFVYTPPQFRCLHTKIFPAPRPWGWCRWSPLLYNHQVPDKGGDPQRKKKKKKNGATSCKIFIFPSFVFLFFFSFFFHSRSLFLLLSTTTLVIRFLLLLSSSSFFLLSSFFLSSSSSSSSFCHPSGA